jgi:hypothetical protein
MLPPNSMKQPRTLSAGTDLPSEERTATARTDKPKSQLAPLTARRAEASCLVVATALARERPTSYSLFCFQSGAVSFHDLETDASAHAET